MEERKEAIPGKFGIRTPPLLDYLQGILRGYSDGQILKELLQNAEDAGASEIRFLYDENHYGTESLLADCLAEFQGPALCSYNNAVFEDRDWKGIQEPAQSCKKNDVLKVGRFGIGFNSVYHLTDLPCIMSRNVLAMIDPFEKYFHFEGRPSSGHSWDLGALPGDGTDQLKPFQEAFPPDVKFEEHGYFRGTFFRFPLRKKPNSLSRSVFTLEKVRDLLQSFKEDASIVLLFLRNIENAAVYWKKEFSSDSQCFLEVSFSPSCLEELRQQRKTFTTALQNFKEKPDSSDNIEIIHTLDIDTTCVDIETEHTQVYTEKWVISQEIATECSKELATLYQKLKFLPWVGVAVPVFNSQETLKGRTFCFLPLPSGEDSLSGLPVHVHGFFGVSDDRRSLKWPSGDQIQNDDAEWNKLLVNEVLPRVYRKALLKAIDVTLEENLSPDIVYKAIPNINGELSHWREAVVTLLSDLFHEKVLYCRARNEWMSADEAIIMTHDLPVTSERARVLVRCLQNSGFHIIEDLPRHVRDAIRKFAPETRYISPVLVINCLKEQSINEYSDEDRLYILDYLLDKLQGPEAMDGLELLPTCDDGFVPFKTHPSTSEVIYMSTSIYSQDLLPGMPHRFVKHMQESHFSTLNQALEKVTSSDNWKQLKCLDVDAVIQLLPETLPTSWNQGGKDSEDWIPSVGDHLNLQWFELFWQFICREDIDLLKLEGLKILPVSDITNEPIKMMALRKNSRIIHVSDDDRAVRNFREIEAVLIEVGVIVCQLPDFVCKHHQILNSSFVHSFHQDGIMKVLKVIGAHDIENACFSSTYIQGKIYSHLLPYLSGTSFSEEDRRFIRDLSIFRTFQNRQAETENLTSINSKVPVLKEEDFRRLPQITFHSKYILVGSNELLVLLEKLGVKPQNFKDALRRIFRDARQGSYPRDEIQVLFEWVRLHYDEISSTIDVEDLKEISFVPNGNEQLRKAKNLYDSSNEYVKCLVLDKEVLLSDNVSSSWLDILMKLGLQKEENITPYHIMKAATNISSQKNVSQATVLMEYICNYPQCLQNSQLCCTLRQTPFIPCKDEPPPFYPQDMPFFPKSGLLYKPSDLVVYSDKMCHLAGGTAPMVDRTSDEILDQLCVRRKPSVKEVVQQMHQCVVSNTSSSQTEMMHHIYEYLNENIGGNQEEILNGLPEKWILVDDQFKDAKSVYKEEGRGAIDLRPFLCILPRKYKEYDDLLRAAGVPDQVDENVSFLVDVFEKIKSNVDTSDNTESVDLNACLRVSINILRRLVEFEEKIEDERITCRLYVPTSCNPMQLLPPDQVCFDDIYDSDNGEDFYLDEDEPPIYLVHSEISSHIAKKLGVMSLTKRLAGADEIGGLKQTGQYEPLTVRLKNILRDGYQPESIPKEMVQNAEDAGASEVKFLLDLRTNTKAVKKLLDPAMEAVHGPALWVYNDAAFTEEDLQNITKLGGATKREDRVKIGQFGLGFNVVYHITDVPSFVTGNFITFFDPHKSHLQRHIRGEGSGIQINFTSNPSRVRRFRDQFLPYEGIFGCKMLGDEDGPKTYKRTLFRLPLRTEAEARKSEIWNESYNEERMKVLLKSLCHHASQMLLFTENVKSISVYLLNEDDDCKPSLLYELVKSTKEQGLGAQSYKKRIYSAVAEQSMSSLPLDTTSVVTFESRWSEKGKQYLQLNDTVQPVIREEWIVTMSAGRGRTYQLCLGDVGAKSGLLPCGGVAWNANANTAGGVYCFLPLSVPQSGLPVCINGCFAVSADRRSLWKDPEAADFKTIWNQSLFEDVIVSAYITLLQQTMVKENVKKCDQLFILWPNPQQTSKNSDYGAAMTAFYRAIMFDGNNENSPKLFMKKDESYSIKEVVFTVDEIQDDGMFPIVERVLKRITSKEVMKIPKWVRTGFVEAECSSDIMSMTYSWKRFFEEVFLPNLSSIEDEDISSLIRHALSEHDGTVLDLMKNSECIPSDAKTSFGRTYKKPSSLLDPSRFKDIFFEEEGVFPEDQFLRSLDMHQKGTLEDIGCLKDSISWEDVLERARTVPSIWQTDPGSARRRVKALLDFMNHKLVVAGNGHQAIENNLRDVAFLPAVLDRNIHLQCPNKVYLSRERDLVGYVCYILDAGDVVCKLSLSPSVQRLLGMHKRRVSPSSVIENLRHLKLLLETGNSPDTVESQCKSMYCFFEKHIEDVEVQHFLQKEEWFFIDQRLIKSAKLSFSGESFPPYLYTIPQQLASRFGKLLRTVGAKDMFNFNDYMRTMAIIEESQHGKPLGTKMVTNILTKVIKPLSDIAEDIPSERIPHILLPDSNNTLQASGTLSFCDLESFEHLIDEYNLCHKEIPLPWAKKLGVRDIRQQMLKKYSHSLPGVGGIGERFGQREELVTRITRIMEGYPCDFTILKELVQNADDAKATSVHFILDDRTHPTEKLFYDSMSDLQGPALLAFNNRPFTDDDITGIQKLGVGSKADDTDKTGRYGVGFNVIYHLTDCPMFLSGGDTLCIFDPTLQYVADADEVCPGRMFTPIDDKLLATYPDIFNCFFSFEKHFQLQEGTLFRFPLRQTKSKIGVQISSSSIVKLFSDFKEEMFDVLLFLKSVTEISFSTCTNGNLVNTYTVKANLSPEHTDARTSFFQRMSTMKDEFLLEIPVSDVQYQVTIVDNCEQRQEWLVHQRLGIEDKDRVPNSVKSVSSVKKLLPKGGVAARCFALEENASKEQGVFQGKAYCFLPLPLTTNLPVHVDGYFALGHEARRNLWEEPPGNPNSDWNRLIAREVIGPAYVLIIQKMKNIFERIKNSHKDINKMRKKLQDYHNLFPLQYRHDVSVRDFWEEITHAFYARVLLKGHKFFPVVQPKYKGKGIREISANQNEFSLMWKSCVPRSDEEGFFDDLYEQIKESQRGESKAPQHKQLQLLLLALGFPLLESPVKLYNIMKNICDNLPDEEVTLLKVNPKSVECFMKTKAVETTLRGLPLKLTETLISTTDELQLLIKYITRTPDVQLNKLPLLLTNDEVLREFNKEAKIFHSPYYRLLPKCSEHFLHRNFLQLLKPNDECFSKLGVHFLVQNLPTHLPVHVFCRGTYVPWSANTDVKFLTPKEDWIEMLWEFFSKECRNNENTLLQLCKEWSILPANIGKEKYLIPMKLAKTVLSPQVFNDHKGLHLIMTRLHAPVLDRQERDHFITRFVSSLGNAQDVLHVFKRIIAVNLEGFKTLKNKDHECILKYFSYFDNFGRENLAVLKCLPCYETIHGEFIALADKTVYSVSMIDVPKGNQDCWISKSGCQFIKEKMYLSALHKILQVEDLSDRELYRRFILPFYEQFTSEVQWEHLSKIMVMVNTDENPKGVVKVLNLKNIRLIPSKGGELKFARSFHDYKNPVFKEMSDKEYFPPKHPRQTITSWQNFLRLIGMQTEVSCDQFLQFSKRVSQDVNNTRREQILVEYLLKSHHLYTDRHFISNLRNVAFISAARVDMKLSELHEQCSVEKVTFAAVPEAHRNLVWSEAPLLPSWVTSKCSSTGGYHLESVLGMIKEPTLALVLKHTTTLCTSLSTLNELPENMEHPAEKHERLLTDILWDIFKFLSNRCERSKRCKPCEDIENCCNVCEEIVKALGEIPVVPLKGGKLFKAKRLTKHVPSEERNALSLFLKQVPDQFVFYSSLLYCLGATKEPSLFQYATILKLVEKQNFEVNPNFIPAAQQATQGFFRCLSHTGNANLDNIDKLPLLSKGKKALLESTKLYFNDKPSYDCRLRHFQHPMMEKINMRDLKTHLSMDELIRKLRHLKPQLISEKVEEISMNSASDVIPDCECPISQQLKEVLSWPVFPHALRIILASEEVTDLTERHDDIFETKFTVKCLREILTELRMTDGTEIPESHRDEGVLLKRKETRKVDVFLSHGANKELIQRQIAEGFNNFFGNFLKRTDNLQIVLTSSSEEDVIRNLSDMGLQLSDYELNYLDKKPILGNVIEEDIICLLVQEPSCRFFTGEYVAYNDTRGADEHYIYARIVSTVGSETNSKGGINHLFMAKYTIDVGCKIQETVEATWLYKFPPPRDDPYTPENIANYDPTTSFEPSTNLQVFEGDIRHQRYENQFDDLDKIKNEITEMIKALRGKDTSIINTVIRRLMRKWHPDKHRDEHKYFAEEVFKHIQREIAELRNHFPCQVDTSDDISKWARENNSQQRHYWNCHRRRFGTAGQQSKRWYGSWHQSNRGHFYTPPSFRKVNLEAYRWQKQACIDRDVATTVVKDHDLSYFQWKSSLCFFAAEKSIRAAQLVCGCGITNSQNIVEAATQLQRHLDVTPAVSKLVQIVKKTSHYPTSCSHPAIPHDVFTKEHADEAMEIACNIINMVERYINDV